MPIVINRFLFFAIIILLFKYYKIIIKFMHCSIFFNMSTPLDICVKIRFFEKICLALDKKLC